MTRFTKIMIVFSLTFAAILFIPADPSCAQVIVMGPAPVAYVPVARHKPLHHSRYLPIMPIQVVTPAYYAPQVPVMPMAAGPVPTMSAYYVPTVPVAQPYFAPVVPVKRIRRHLRPVYPPAVHPVYWAPY